MTSIITPDIAILLAADTFRDLRARRSGSGPWLPHNSPAQPRRVLRLRP